MRDNLSTNVSVSLQIKLQDVLTAWWAIAALLQNAVVTSTAVSFLLCIDFKSATAVELTIISSRVVSIPHV